MAYKETEKLRFHYSVFQVAVLVSGSGSNLQALIDTTRDSSQCMCAEITLVISNKKDAYALQRAEKAGIPTLVSYS